MVSELDRIVKEIKVIKVPYEHGLLVFLSKNGYSFYRGDDELLIDITSLTRKELIKIKRRIRKKLRTYA